MARCIYLLPNPAFENEKALKQASWLRRQLAERQVDHQVFDEAWPEDLSGASEVWIIGGDGTLNHFINRFPGCTLPLALFPGGTGNDFHWMLYGETSLEAQLGRVLQASPRPVDAGTCNGQLFLNGIGIGFDGAIVRDLIGKKKLAGKASYLLSILKNILRYEERSFNLQAGAEKLQQDCLMISVANGKRYGGGFCVAPRAHVDDGLLDLALIGRISPLKRMRYLPVMERGQHLALPFVTYRQLASVVIETAVPVPAHADGEYFTAARFEIGLLPARFSFIY